jgi:spore coat polysaccharide biosynthesis protein SpsF (cytidylyltransferase family)
MSLLDTLEYFIKDQEGHLQCLEWDIREETNYENNNIDWYTEQYDLTKQRIEDLKQIKTIVEHLEQNK